MVQGGLDLLGVTGLRVQMSYMHGATVLAQDPSCAAPVSIAPGKAGQIACYKRAVQGANQIAAEIVDVQF